MSTTTYTNTTQVLQDYEIHLTGASSPLSLPPSNNTTLPHASHSNIQQVDNPIDWPNDYRRVPPYRPINRNLDVEQRPAGQPGVERVFIKLMFTGVALNAGTAKLWGATGGKIFKNLFKYKIGGER